MSQAINIDFQWADYQYDVIKALEAGTCDIAVLRTGYGGGKSVTGAQWIHKGSMELLSGESLVLAPDYQKGGPATYRVFFETLPGENTVPNDADGDPENSPIVAGYNQNQKRVTYVSGHVVRLGSADVWNRYAGSEFHRVWMDEPAHYDNTDLYDLHEMIVSRQRTRRGPNTCLMTSTGNGYEQFYDVTERQVQPNGEGGEEPLSWRDTMTVFVESSLRNPFLTQSAKDKLRRQFEGTPREEQALHGGFSAAQGLVYGEFNRKTHVRESLPELRNTRLYGYDHGWKDPRVLLEIGISTYDQYVVIDEYYETKEKLKHAKDWLQQRDSGTIYSEHEPEHQQEFAELGFDIVPAIKDLDEGIPAVRERFELDGDKPGIIVSDRCVNLIQELLSYKEEHVGKSKATDHAADALRYCIATRELDHDTTPSIEDSFTF